MRTAAFPLSDNKVKSSKEVQGELVTGINMNGAGDATTTNNFYSINSVNKTITNTNIAQDNIHELKSRKLPVIEESSLDIGNNASGFRNKTALNNDTNNTGAINSFTFYVTVTNSSKDGVSHIKDDTGQANAEVAKKDFKVSKPEKSYNKEAITNKQKETTKLTTALKTSAEKGIDSNKLSTNMDVISIENPITDLRNSTLDEEETSKDILIGQDEGVSRDLVLRYTEDSGVQPEEPTSRIVVTVMKRSGRYWEPWELNHSTFIINIIIVVVIIIIKCFIRLTFMFFFILSVRKRCIINKGNTSCPLSFWWGIQLLKSNWREGLGRRANIIEFERTQCNLLLNDF